MFFIFVCWFAFHWTRFYMEGALIWIRRKILLHIFCSMHHNRGDNLSFNWLNFNIMMSAITSKINLMNLPFSESCVRNCDTYARSSPWIFWWVNIVSYDIWVRDSKLILLVSDSFTNFWLNWNIMMSHKSFLRHNSFRLSSNYICLYFCTWIKLWIGFLRLLTLIWTLRPKKCF